MRGDPRRAGARADTGNRADAGARVDVGARADAGARVDAGARADAGTRAGRGGRAHGRRGCRGGEPTAGARAWWKDPVGGALVGVGVLGLGAGSALLLSARSAERAKATATTYGEFQALDDRATSRGTLGVVMAASGGVLLGAGMIWYVTRDPREPRARLTGWFTSDGGGLVAAGRF